MLSHSDTLSPGEIVAMMTLVWVLSQWHPHTAVSNTLQINIGILGEIPVERT